MIFVHHTDGTTTDHDSSGDGAIDEIDRTETPTWVDVVDPSTAELEALAARLDLHPLALEDAVQGNQRPRYAQYENHAFVVLHDLPLSVPEGRDGHQVPIPGRGQDIYVFFAPTYFVTVHRGESPMVAVALKRWRQSKDLQKRGRLLQLYVLIDSVIDEYIEALDEINDQVSHLEEVVITRSEQNPKRFRAEPPSMVRDLLHLRRSLLDMRRTTSHMRDAINVLLRRVESLSEADKLVSETTTRECFSYYQDAYDHTMRIVDSLDTYRDLLSGVLDAHLAVTSNRLNEVVKVLTSVSIILMSLSLITGLYGMNFVHMPELHWKYGYAYALILMLVITWVQWLYFRRKRWI